MIKGFFTVKISMEDTFDPVGKVVKACSINIISAKSV